jgi:hypothetical protein
VWGRFAAPIQTVLGGHPSHTVRSGSFSRAKRPGFDVTHSPTSTAEAEEGVKLHLYFPSVPSWHVMG